MEKIMKKVEEFSEDDEILGAYDAEWHRKEVERVVRIAQLEEAREEGLSKGMAEGIEKGMQQGMEKTAKNMKKENIDIEVISRVTGLSIEHIKGL